MDSPTSTLDQTQSVDLSKLTPQDQRELQQFVTNEMSKAKVQQSVHNLTDVCWRKCITGPIKNGKLDRNEESCAQNCVDRYLDANFAIIKHLEKMRVNN